MYGPICKNSQHQMHAEFRMWINNQYRHYWKETARKEIPCSKSRETRGFCLSGENPSSCFVGSISIPCHLKCLYWSPKSVYTKNQLIKKHFEWDMSNLFWYRKSMIIIWSSHWKEQISMQIVDGHRTLAPLRTDRPMNILQKHYTNSWNSEKR